MSDYVKQIDNSTFKILKRALPGPYTFILPGSNTLPKIFKKKKIIPKINDFISPVKISNIVTWRGIGSK